MKVIGLKDTDLATCVSKAQNERIVITRNGKPVALVVGVEGLDTEQLELGSNPAFWELIERRRRQVTITRAQLEEKIRQSDKRQSKAAQHAAANRRSARIEAAKSKRDSRAARG